jgi:hypothetical protein
MAKAALSENDIYSYTCCFASQQVKVKMFVILLWSRCDRYLVSLVLLSLSQAYNCNQYIDQLNGNKRRNQPT